MRLQVKYLPKIASTILVVCIFCFFWLKSSILTVWMYPDKTEKYVIEGEDGRTQAMIFLPSNRTLIHYTDTTNREAETVLTQMRGSFGTHYFGPIWQVEGPYVTYGLRWVPNGGRPIIMETKYLQKFKTGPGKTKFPKVGKTSYPEIIFGDGCLKWQGMWFTKVEPDQAEIDELLSLMRKTGSTGPET